MIDIKEEIEHQNDIKLGVRMDEDYKKFWKEIKLNFKLRINYEI